MVQCLPVKNLRRPPDLGGSLTLSGVPTKTQAPTRSLASLLTSGASLDGLSSARTGSVPPVGSTRADATKTPAIRMPRCVVGLFMADAPVFGVIGLRLVPKVE